MHCVYIRLCFYSAHAFHPRKMSHFEPQAKIVAQQNYLFFFFAFGEHIKPNALSSLQRAFQRVCELDYFPSSWSNKMKITKPVKGTVHKSCWDPWGLFSPPCHLYCGGINLICMCLGAVWSENSTLQLW